LIWPEPEVTTAERNPIQYLCPFTRLVDPVIVEPVHACMDAPDVILIPSQYANLEPGNPLESFQTAICIVNGGVSPDPSHHEVMLVRVPFSDIVNGPNATWIPAGVHVSSWLYGAVVDVCPSVAI
jgi:hypothetical protein